MRLQEEVQQSLESDSEVMDAASEDGERGFEPVTAQAFGPSAKPMSAEQPSMLFGDSFIAAMQNADATAEATRSENANIANGERAASGMATEEVEERNSERSVSNQTFGDAQTETIGGAADENESAGADNDEVFVGTDDKDAEKLKKVVDQLIQTFPNSWKEMVLSFGKPTKLSSEKRLRTYRKRMIKKGSVEIASRALRFAKFILQYQWENHLGPLDMSADVLIDAFEEHQDLAEARAKARAKKATANDKKPRRNCRGGKTATLPMYYGARTLGASAGLPVDFDHPEVKEVARAGPGMPAVKRMTSIKTIAKYEKISSDATKSKFVRAYAGGTWVKVPAGTRTIDMQRTAKVTIEHVKILGQVTPVLTGVAKRSKAKSQIEMRPLVWRAPLIPISESALDLGPLMESMPKGATNGCVFRDFVTPPGVPHTIDHAIAWKNSAASHETIVNSIEAITGDDNAGGHEERHVTAEVGRCIKLPRSTREGLGNWRVQPVIANDPQDEKAQRAAITNARKRRTRIGSIISSADRYSSVSGEAIEQDEARVACLLAIRTCYKRKWAQDGVPESTDEQLRDISDGEKKA
jgi:hypothetical protein